LDILKGVVSAWEEAAIIAEGDSVGFRKPEIQSIVQGSSTRVQR
jgi:hypothetical protein